MTKLVINPSKKQSKINKEIYGHFSEHLGRCIRKIRRILEQ